MVRKRQEKLLDSYDCDTLLEKAALKQVVDYKKEHHMYIAKHVIREKIGKKTLEMTKVLLFPAYHYERLSPTHIFPFLSLTYNAFKLDIFCNIIL